MPRRGRSASPPPRRAAPARAAPPQRAAHPPAPVAPPQHQPMMAPPASQGPGLMGQMMATAGGVAIGSTVGHVVGHAITGGMGGGGRGESADVAPASSGETAPIQNFSAPMGGQQQQQENGACSWEMKQFLQCAQTQGDLSLCEGFNEALRQCRQYNGISQ